MLIDTDYNAPQMNVWYPNKSFSVDTSLSRLLSNRVNEETIMGKTQVMSKTLGVLGYTKDFASTSAPRRTDTTIEMFECLKTITDYVIVDCQYSPLNDMITFEAANSADVILLNLSPDIKALSWYDTNVRMLEEGWSVRPGITVKKIFNKALPISPVDEIEKITGTIDYCLPFNMEIAEQIYNGTLGSSSNPGSREYAQVIRSMATELIEKNEGPAIVPAKKR